MQDGEEADRGPEVLGVGRDRAQGVGGGPEEDAVDERLVLQGDGGDRLRDGEDDVEVRGVEELGVTVLDPLGPGQRLAAGAVPVAAGVVPDAGVVAAIALLDMPAEGGGPAGLDRVHDPPLGGRQGALLRAAIGLAVAAEDVRPLQRRPSHRPTLRSERWRRGGRILRRLGPRQQVEGAGGRAHLGRGDSQVAGGGGEAAMPEEELDRAEIGAGLQQVYGEGMATISQEE